MIILSLSLTFAKKMAEFGIILKSTPSIAVVFPPNVKVTVASSVGVMKFAYLQ